MRKKITTNQIILGYIAISFLIMYISLIVYSWILFSLGGVTVVTAIFIVVMMRRSGTMDA